VFSAQGVSLKFLRKRRVLAKRRVIKRVKAVKKRSPLKSIEWY
jgi:hypothetical protein